MRSLWSPGTEMSVLGLSPLFSALCFGENMFSSLHSPNISVLSPPLLFYFFIFFPTEIGSKTPQFHCENNQVSIYDFLSLIISSSSSRKAKTLT